jgi:ABC-2 type transport system ATP-binding protein
MSEGQIRAEGSPVELRAALGAGGGTLEDVFVRLTAGAQAQGGEFHDISRTRRTARRLG